MWPNVCFGQSAKTWYFIFMIALFRTCRTTRHFWAWLDGVGGSRGYTLSELVFQQTHLTALIPNAGHVFHNRRNGTWEETYPFDLDFLLLSSGRPSSDRAACTTSISMTSTALFFRPCCWCCGGDFSLIIVTGSAAAALPELNPLNLFTFDALDSIVSADGRSLPWKAENADEGTPLCWPWYGAVGPHFEEQPAFAGGIAPDVGDSPKAGWFKCPAFGAAPAIEGKNGECPYFCADRLVELDIGFADRAVGAVVAVPAKGWWPGFEA